MKPRAASDDAPVLRTLLRRSKDEGQEFSLDVQREGCARFGEQLLRRAAEWRTQREYVDDGIAGDDFIARAGLRRLLEELRAGDLVVCRDHSRLGRDALEVTLVVREIVRDRQARLFYYSSGQEVSFTTAIDAATTFIQGVGAQMELEAIRSRTREALRARVRQGHIAGGRCYGYTNVRKTDASGRQFTIAVVNEEEAAVVREVFHRYIEGEGIKRIADVLNRRAVPSPHAGRRGTGSWSIGAVRELIGRERYHGVYVHGQIDRVRKGGRRVAVPAANENIMRVEVPAWRIIDEETWERAQAISAERAKNVVSPGPRPRYPLTGLGRCGVCGGPIGLVNTAQAAGRLHAYACTYHHKRGPAVCPVTIYQPAEEVDGPLADYVLKRVLSPDRIESMITGFQAALEAERAKPTAAQVARLERELEKLRGEQRKYAAAVAAAPDVPELLRELRQRSDRIRQMEGELASLRRPRRDADLAEVARLTRERLENWRDSLRGDRDAARAVFAALFPDGLTFTPVDVEPAPDAPRRHGRPRKQVWAVSATAHLGGLLSPIQVTPPGLSSWGNKPRNYRLAFLPGGRIVAI